ICASITFLKRLPQNIDRLKLQFAVWREGSGVRGCLAASLALLHRLRSERIGASDDHRQPQPLTPGPSPEGEGSECTSSILKTPISLGEGYCEHALNAAAAPFHSVRCH